MIRKLKNFLKTSIQKKHYNVLKRINQKLRRPFTILRLKLNEKTHKEFLDDIDSKLQNFTGSGVQANENKIIVSLTSFPERMDKIHYALYSLLTQTLKPDMVVLWLGEEQFPNREKDIPQSVLNLQKNGLTIKYCEDIRAYTKLIPSLKAFPDDIIITADDDIFYPDALVEDLYAAYTKNPEYIQASRVHRVKLSSPNSLAPYSTWKSGVPENGASFLNFLTGVGGVLYPPHSLDEEVLNEANFKKLAPYADDVWFWAMAVKKGTKINNISTHTELYHTDPFVGEGLSGKFTLGSLNFNSDGNDRQLKAVLDCYNLWSKLQEK